MRDKNRRETRPYSSASKLQNTVLLLGLQPFHTSSPNRCAVYAYPKSNCQTRPYACRPYAQVPGAKTRVPLSLWPGRHGFSLTRNKLNQKDVKLGMSKTRLSVMLALVYLSFLFCSSCQTWVLMSWESLGLIVSTKHTAEIIQPEALLISTNFSNEVPTVTHKISLRS